MLIFVNFDSLNKLNFLKNKKELIPNTACWFEANNKTGFLVILPNYQNLK